MIETTVVTVFYPLTKSKHSVEKYMGWAKNFFNSCTSAVVCFTTVEYIKLFEPLTTHISSRVLFIPSTLQDWNLAKHPIWDSQLSLDPENSYHSVELYKVWAIKQEVVCDVIRRNPFQSSTFVWCDIGCFRDMNEFSKTPSFATIPEHLKLSTPWFACLQVADVLRVKHAITPMIHLVPIQSIGGGVLAGNREGWLEFSKAYLQELNEMIREGIFIGKDQHVYRRIIFNNKIPHVTTYIVQPQFDRLKTKENYWFYLTYLFSGLSEYLR